MPYGFIVYGHAGLDAIFPDAVYLNARDAVESFARGNLVPREEAGEDDIYRWRLELGRGPGSTKALRARIHRLGRVAGAIKWLEMRPQRGLTFVRGARNSDNIVWIRAIPIIE